MYSRILFDPSQITSTQLLPGWVACGEFILGENDTIRFKMVRANPTQDSSIRCWWSKLPEGPSLSLKPVVGYWHLNRIIAEEMVLTSSKTPILNPHMKSHVLYVEPGTYWINALNMINTPNPFFSSIERGELDD